MSGLPPSGSVHFLVSLFSGKLKTETVPSPRLETYISLESRLT